MPNPFDLAMANQVGELGQLINISSLGISDAQARLLGPYMVDDLMGDLPYTWAAAGGANAQVGFAVPTPGGIPTPPPGWTFAQLIQHDGVWWLQTKDVNNAVSFMAAANASGFFLQHKNGPPRKFEIDFSLPNALSVPGDRYIYQIGVGAANANNIWIGAYISYSDNVNDGKWVLYESNSGVIGTDVLIANSAVPPVAGAWNRLEILINGATVTANLNGALLATGTSQTLNDAAQAMLLTKLAAFFKRTTSTGAVLTAFLDRVAMIPLGPVSRV